MPLIDLTDPLTFNIRKYDESIYDRYLEELFNSLKYNVCVVSKQCKLHVIGISDFIKTMNSKRNEFSVEIPETYEGIIFKFKKAKKFVKADNKRNEILSLVLNIPTFVNIAKRVKTFLDLEKESVGKNAVYKDGFVQLNLKGAEFLIDTVKSLTEEFNIKFDTVEDNSETYLKIPVERLMQLGFSNPDISTVLHLIMSAFKYTYAIEESGQDFNKRCQLKAELLKWKNTASYEVSEILKKR